LPVSVGVAVGAAEAAAGGERLGAGGVGGRLLAEQPVGDLAGARRGRQVGRQRLQARPGPRAHGLLRQPQQVGQLAVGQPAAQDQLDGGALVGRQALQLRARRGHRAAQA
jgi:hypothetical protein